jgi:hypothetical protein
MHFKFFFEKKLLTFYREIKQTLYIYEVEIVTKKKLRGED